MNINDAKFYYDTVTYKFDYCNCASTIKPGKTFPEIKKVIFNGPATIVFWDDGEKTIVKCMDEDIYDPEKGLAMAICKKVLGDKFKSIFKKFIEENDENKRDSEGIDYLEAVKEAFLNCFLSN
jgi:hypothetical protein